MELQHITKNDEGETVILRSTIVKTVKETENGFEYTYMNGESGYCWNTDTTKWELVFDTRIFQSNDSIFLPTSKLVEERYLNGEVGEQLWEQMFQGKLTGNLWTMGEILALNPTKMKLVGEKPTISIKRFKKAANNRDTEYLDGKPVVETIERMYSFPLKFGYGSYNEPKRLLNASDTYLDDLIEINIV